MRSAKEANEDFEVEAPPPSISLLGPSFLRALFKFLRLTEIHDPTNAIFDQGNQELMRIIPQLIKHFGQAGITFTLRGEICYINQRQVRPIPREFYVYRYLSKFFKQRGMQGFRILTMPQENNMKLFLWLIANLDKEFDDKIDINRQLKDQGIVEFEIYTIKVSQSPDVEGSRGGNNFDLELAIASIYQRLHKFVETCFDNYRNRKSINLTPIQSTLQELATLTDQDIIDLLRLLYIKRYDRPLPYLAVNSAFLMAGWAKSLRLPSSVICELAGSALLHPIAYLIEEELGLNIDSEANRIQRLRFIENVKDIWQMSEVQTLSQLEWNRNFSENGVYVVGTTKCYSHFYSRMLKIVATYEKLTTHMKSSPAILPEEAIAKTILDANSCDKTLSKLFVNWVGIYPLGSLVVLNTGEIAQVFAGASNPISFQRPIVRIIKSTNGEMLKRAIICDLSEVDEKLGIYKKSIKKNISYEEANLAGPQFKI